MGLDNEGLNSCTNDAGCTNQMVHERDRTNFAYLAGYSSPGIVLDGDSDCVALEPSTRQAIDVSCATTGWGLCQFDCASSKKKRLSRK